MEISPHRSDVSSNVPAHVCCGMSGYPVISCRGSWHGFMWCRRLCYFWLSRHPWPFAHFWAVFVKMGFCAETSMPGICTSWGWGQQNSAEGHASWSSPRAENFLPAVLLCGRWLEDPGRALRPLRPGMVAGHLSHFESFEFRVFRLRQADSANNSADYVSPAGLPWTVLESAWHFDVSTWPKYLQ